MILTTKNLKHSYFHCLNARNILIMNVCARLLHDCFTIASKSDKTAHFSGEIYFIYLCKPSTLLI